MEILITIVSFLFLGGLLISPFLILYALNRKNTKYKFIAYLAFGILVTATITFTFAWWADTSNEILLTHYGYNFDAIDDTELYEKVTQENIERVKSLEISMMGIGWPLRAIMTYEYYSPYLLIIFLAVYLLRAIRAKKAD
ncbi:hypothetical protein [Fulvivirga sp.]|uniref:hypothetical protein n=1 Tax=Fulvivirga sp. TaxID=1931237 RepID=UPI0032ECC2FA